MPQETALIGELTIKETIYYFGKIFQVEMERLRERYTMLKNLLELPRGDQRVEECSGGQQRRVSFAAAMIHEPDLLILDEPTVGLDPILREKIWDFMLHVTTHYIDEAKQADRCGLMRNGILLAEDTPRNIISRHEVENLEEAFLKLCTKRGISEEALEDDKVLANITARMPDNLELEERVDQNRNDTVDEATQPAEPSLFKRKTYAWSTMRALFTKNYLQMKRQPA
jgi:ABC-type multidrug transport system ATPase subunit